MSNLPVAQQEIVRFPNFVSEFNDQHFHALALPESERKISLDVNDLMMLARENPALIAMDFVNFAKTAQTFGAHPMKKEIFLVTMRKNAKYKDNRGNWIDNWITRGDAIFGWTFFLKRAQEHPEFVGYSDVQGVAPYLNPITNEATNQSYVTATVYRMKNGHKIPFSFTAWWPEFVKMKDGYNGAPSVPQNKWATMPRHMLWKCAMANALRQAFIESLGGMFIHEEMGRDPGEGTIDVSNRQTIQQTAQAQQAAAPAPAPAPAPEAASPPPPDVIDVDENPAPVETESQETADETTEAPAPAAEVDDAKPATAHTKRLLMSVIKQGETGGHVKATEAFNRLQQVNVTESLAQRLIELAKANDFSWFKNGGQ